MDWNKITEKLQLGETVQIRPKGNSMSGKIENGQLVTISPYKISDLNVGDIVLCKVKGVFYIHLIKAMKDGRFQIGNNKGGINGWIGIHNIFGKVTKVE